jgi:hypothetical protein
MNAPEDTKKPVTLRNRLIRRQPWENIATGLIGVGVVMLLQPLSLTLYSYSLMTMLGGIIMFTVVSKFPE